MANYLGDDRLEKFYTPTELVDELFIMKEKYCDVEVVEYLENSAGGGAICDRFDKPYIAYDIEPEPNRPDIIKADYKKLKLGYKPGRVAIINPPFQRGLYFVYKALKECDWVFCILSQNSILNLDYKNIWAEEIQLWRMYNFGKCKVSITLMALRPRREGDRYEWEEVNEPLTKNIWW
jgi:hypothetical protein